MTRLSQADCLIVGDVCSCGMVEGEEEIQRMRKFGVVL